MSEDISTVENLLNVDRKEFEIVRVRKIQMYRIIIVRDLFSDRFIKLVTSEDGNELITKLILSREDIEDEIGSF